jgi:hypothetical protein
MSTLTPGQFRLSDRYASQIASLTAQIDAIKQPSVVNIHHYTPTDADFIKAPTPITKGKGKSIVKISEPIQEDISEPESLNNTIFHLEEEIKEK